MSPIAESRLVVGGDFVSRRYRAQLGITPFEDSGDYRGGVLTSRFPYQAMPSIQSHERKKVDSESESELSVETWGEISII